MSKWNMIITGERCINCNNCVIAAKDEYVGNEFPGYSAPAGATDDTMLRILRRVQGAPPMVETAYLPVMCNHCDDAPCKRVGGDAVIKRPDGIVIIDPVKARGRKDIVRSCPYKAIVWNEQQQVPQTWIFDAHLLDQGWDKPRCQQSCPTGVFEAVKLDDAAMQEKAASEGLRVLLPKLGAQPRVWYRGLENWEDCFIGGSVSSRQYGLVDCVAGACVTLSRAGRKLAETTTDSFGDFRFGGLAAKSGGYCVEVTHGGMTLTKECELDESVYLGEMRFEVVTG